MQVQKLVVLIYTIFFQNLDHIQVRATAYARQVFTSW